MSKVLRRDYLNTIEMGLSRLDDYRAISMYENIKADRMERPIILGKVEDPIDDDTRPKSKRKM